MYASNWTFLYEKLHFSWCHWVTGLKKVMLAARLCLSFVFVSAESGTGQHPVWLRLRRRPLRDGAQRMRPPGGEFFFFFCTLLLCLFLVQAMFSVFIMRIEK